MRYSDSLTETDYEKIIADCKKTFKNRKGKEGNTFLCSGDIGSIIACMYIMKKAGGGILYLNSNPANGLPLNQMGTPAIKPASFSIQGFTLIKPLLEAQSYVKAVLPYTGNEEITFDLDCYRICYFIPELIDKTHCIMMLALKETWGTAVSFKKPWIEVPEKKELDRKLIVGRSILWHGGEIMYTINRDDITEGAHFIGSQTEYIMFMNTSSSTPWRLNPKDMLETAEMVVGSEKVMCNDCELYWLALALGVKSIDFELCPDVYNCLSDSKKVRYFLGDTFMLPDISFITGKKKEDEQGV